MTQPRIEDAVLDNPVWAALRGPQAHLAEVRGRAGRYPADVAPFHGAADLTDPAAWADLARLTGPEAEVFVAGLRLAPPPGWATTFTLPGVQLVDAGMAADDDPEAVVLSTADVPDMLDLAARTRPGPFRSRSLAMGRFVGLRRDGALIAMAGERLRPPGWTEITAVCTDPAHRGQGLAARLVRAVAAGIRQRGDTAFLHAAADNTNAIRLYEKLGFALRTPVTFAGLRSPA
ncbi:FR47-like protein [Krasilnikovia cinnamomea]|uniref:FR47-like protein n=1 Tax=Krasilnikovia cinnamomea TaxID=349313 RepID=A0A4Q7ZCH9_9ACTN|nr:GNAT family N-acetyltransferase [Krasilnikovia cinnamomea]RZU48362.1 FR47-like protein [Krasilnikovia cinnamomea]